RILVVDLFCIRNLVRLTLAGSELPVRIGCSRRSDQCNLLLESQKLSICSRFPRSCLEPLEITRETIAREFLVDLDMRPDLTLVLVDLLLHSRECLDRRFLRDRGHRLRDPLLSFGAALLCEQQILLARCL